MGNDLKRGKYFFIIVIAEYKEAIKQKFWRMLTIWFGCYVRINIGILFG